MHDPTILRALAFITPEKPTPSAAKISWLRANSKVRCPLFTVCGAWSADRDFSAFSQLKASNPLVKK